jgi:hypothetical protein
VNIPRLRIVMLVAVCSLVLGGALPVAAYAPADPAFERTWARIDKPVAAGRVDRTWMWGPEANSVAMLEEYAEAPGGYRTVQYFDKTRMEITHPGGNQNSLWYVTNGLLVMEMVSGRMQVGDNQFYDYAPSEQNVAGDQDDPLGPTYGTFARLVDATPLQDNAVITQRVNRAGQVTYDPALAAYDVRTAKRITVPHLDHQVAAPFWEFMNASGDVYQNGSFISEPLFPDPVYATGLPITEAYWAEVKVGGVYMDVLMQCFERRCLTYTPGNPDGWKVEAGNVGQHYYLWRYDDVPAMNGGPCPAETHGFYSIYVADRANNRIQKFDEDQFWVCSFGAGIGVEGIKSPWAINVDANGAVEVLSNGRIQAFTSRGMYDGSFPVPFGTIDFARDSQGRFITVAQNNPTITIYDRYGEYESQMVNPVTPHQSPIAVAVDAHDNIYVLDRGQRAFTKYSPTGQVLEYVGSPGMPSDPKRFDVPTDIAVREDGLVYVTDSGYVKTFAYQGSAYQPAGHWGGDGNLTFAGDGRIALFYHPSLNGTTLVFVGDTLNDQVRIWAHGSGSTANLNDIIGEEGFNYGQFRSPIAVALALN